MDMILKAETLPEDIAFFAKLLNVSVSDFNEYCILNLQISNIFLVILQHLIDPEAQYNSRSSPLRQSDEAFFSQLPLSVVKRLYWKLRPVRRNCFQCSCVCLSFLMSTYQGFRDVWLLARGVLPAGHSGQMTRRRHVFSCVQFQ